MEPNTASLAVVLICQAITIIVAAATIICVALLVAIQHDRIRYGHTVGAYVEWTFGLSLASVAGFGLTMAFWMGIPSVAS